MRAAARIGLVRRGGADVLVDARSEPPLSIRATPDRVLVVGSAAAPVGGDELDLTVEVGPDARARVGSAAATVVWPGVDGVWSSQHTSIAVGAGGHVDWQPEPTVSVAGSRHRARTEVTLGDGATATIVEEVSLGRAGEAGGRLDVELRVVRAGVVVVHHAEQLGPDVPGWGAAAHVGSARHLVTAVTVGPPAGPPVTLVADPGAGLRTGCTAEGSAARLPLADDVAISLVVAIDRPAAHRLLARLAACGRDPERGRQ